MIKAGLRRYWRIRLRLRRISMIAALIANNLLTKKIIDADILFGSQPYGSKSGYHPVSVFL
jgi:hypothetical protein